jgi:glutamate-5-semialdehyde dehydrogenase
MDIERTIRQMAREAKQAAAVISRCTTAQKNRALTTMADMLEQRAETIFQENRKDLKQADEAGLASAMVDRLTVTEETIAAMAGGLREVASYADPVGTMGETRVRPNGLRVSKMRIPLGVIGIIYESRPNVTIDAAGLCLKSGNAVILRGGSEALHSNRALASIIGQALESVGLPSQAAQVVPTEDRQAINALLAQEDFVDLIIPRGGEGLIRFVVENSRIPVLKH